MKPPSDWIEVIDRKRYNVDTATLLAGDDWWDGHNFERSGRNMFLYRTPNGRYFTISLTCWEGERNTLTPVSLDEAIEYFERLRNKRVEYGDAFPGVEVEDA